MELEKCLKKADYKKLSGLLNVSITGIANDSRDVCPGNLFIAKRGSRFNANRFIRQAVEKGALVIVSDQKTVYQGVVQLQTDDIKHFEKTVSKNYYNDPSNKLRLIGITGTNGKTTTSFFLKALLDGFWPKTGLIGTCKYVIGEKEYPSSHTTPDIVKNQKILNQMVQEGAKAAVMEVSSHGLSQDRVEGLTFSRTLFTNLTHDHLDYHKTFSNYLSAKEKLFKMQPEIGIVNRDDPYHGFFSRHPSNILTYGIENDADIKGKILSQEIEKMEVEVEAFSEKQRFFLPFLGLHNFYNFLAALSVCLSYSFTLSQMKPGLLTFPSVPGRLEKIADGIFIDYAHTPDALKKVLSALKKVTEGKLILVFGCGGNRDAEKRAPMGDIAKAHADCAIVTNDNPRDEDPDKIISEITRNHPFFLIEKDRRSAIKKALELSGKKDTILIAGKGHEKTQMIKDQMIPFEDKQIILEFINL